MEPNQSDVSNLTQSPRDFQAESKYLQAVADYRRYLNLLRWMQDNDMEPTGFYRGDGVPRDFAGHPFEPLDWKGLAGYERHDEAKAHAEHGEHESRPGPDELVRHISELEGWA